MRESDWELWRQRREELEREAQMARLARELRAARRGFRRSTAWSVAAGNERWRWQPGTSIRAKQTFPAQLGLQVLGGGRIGFHSRPPSDGKSKTFRGGTMKMQDTIFMGGERIAYGKPPGTALLAASAAAASNALLYYVASALGLIPQSVFLPMPGGEAPPDSGAGRDRLGHRSNGGGNRLRPHRLVRPSSREAVPHRRRCGAGALVPGTAHHRRRAAFDGPLD
jgi:hypothetical protein